MAGKPCGSVPRTQEKKHMSQLADIIQRYYDAFNRRDFAAYERLFTPDCLIEAPGVQLRGIPGARGFDQVWQTALPDSKINNLAKTTSGTMVMCENRIKGTHTGPLVTGDGTLPATGRTFDEPYVAVFELDGERIKRQTLHFDRVQVMNVLGPRTNEQTVKAIYAAFPRGDVKFILDQCADDVSWGIDSAATEVKPYGVRHGRDGVASFFAAWGETADFHSFEASEYVSTGDHVFCVLRYELTVKANGNRLACKGSAQHWQFRDGKLVSWRGYEDSATTRDAFTAKRA
jgi:steroid delta-isomerase-like uncharacterized protein